MTEDRDDQKNVTGFVHTENLTEKHRKPNICMLFVITSTKLANKAERMFDQGRVSLLYRSYGRGTASSEMMDLLGLSGVEKGVLISMLPKPFADEMLKKLRKELRLGLVDTGVAFTVHLSAANGKLMKLLEKTGSPESEETSDAFEAGDRGFDTFKKRSEMKMEESGYSLIMAIVDRGYSEAVMEAARPVGATGGTVVNSRRVGTEEAMRFWGISVQPERELVLILVGKDEKKNIMKAIAENCGMRSEAHGVVISLPVDSVVGLD